MASPCIEYDPLGGSIPCLRQSVAYVTFEIVLKYVAYIMSVVSCDRVAKPLEFLFVFTRKSVFWLKAKLRKSSMISML